MWQLTRANLKRHRGMRHVFIAIIALLVAMMYAVAALIEARGLTQAITYDNTTAGLLPVLLVVVLVVMMLMTVVFVTYLNSLLMVRREAEFGLYRRLGMPAGRLGISLSLEVAYSGLIGLGLGLAGGILLSKLLAMILLRLVNVAEPVGVLFSPVALAEVAGFTVLLLGLLAGLRCLAVAGKDLTHFWQAEHQAATPALNGTLAWLGAFGALVLLGGGDLVIFQLFTWHRRFSRWFGAFIGPSSLVLVVLIAELVGVYLLYACLLPLVIAGLLRCRFAQVATRYLALVHLQNRLRRNTQSLWLTTWLTAVTLVMLGSAAMLFQFGQNVVDQDIAQPVLVTPAAQRDVQALVAGLPSRHLPTKLVAGHVTLRTRTSAAQSERGLYQVLATSAYDRIRQKQPQLPPIHLQGRQATLIMLGKRAYHAHAFGRWSNIGRIVTLPRTGERFSIRQITDDFPLGSAGYFDRALVVTDAAYAHLRAPVDTLVGYWPAKARQKAITRRLAAVAIQEYAASDAATLAGRRAVGVSTREPTGTHVLARAGVSLRGPQQHLMRVVFGSLFFAMILLGVVFMVATASILLLKQLATAHSQRQSRQILSRLGMPDAALKRVRDTQVLAVFGLPLVVGGLTAAGSLRFLATVLDASAQLGVILATCGYVLVYLVFAVLTASHLDRY